MKEIAFGGSDKRYIFATNTIGLTSEELTNTIGLIIDEPTNFDNIMETVNDFQCFDYLLECADDLLTEHIIKKFYAIILN